MLDAALNRYSRRALLTQSTKIFYGFIRLIIFPLSMTSYHQKKSALDSRSDKDFEEMIEFTYPWSATYSQQVFFLQQNVMATSLGAKETSNSHGLNDASILHSPRLDNFFQTQWLDLPTTLRFGIPVQTPQLEATSTALQAYVPNFRGAGILDGTSTSVFSVLVR